MIDIATTARIKAKKFVDWLDSVPSVPAALGGVAVGMIVPKTLVIVLAIAGVIWAVSKFGGLDET